MTNSTPKRKTILIVDDEEDLAYLTSQHLRLENYDTLLAFNGIQALQQLSKNHVDLVVSDIRMPQMDGITLLQKINETYEKNIPVILVTGFSEINHQTAINKGAIDLLKKPVDVELLEKTILRIFS